MGSSLAEIISDGKGRAGSGGAWRVWQSDDTYELWHHSTLMLRWRHTYEGNEVLYTSLGWGSVSDQNGMNIAFRTLRVPYRYDRAGGAQITELCTCGMHQYAHHPTLCDPEEIENRRIKAEQRKHRENVRTIRRVRTELTVILNRTA